MIRKTELFITDNVNIGPKIVIFEIFYQTLISFLFNLNEAELFGVFYRFVTFPLPLLPLDLLDPTQ